MAEYVQVGLVVDEAFLGAALHIDEVKHEAWVMFRSGPGVDASGRQYVTARAAVLGYEPIPEDEDDDVLEFLPGGYIRHWLVRAEHQEKGEAAA